MLLHNGNKFACVPIGYSVIVKEHYLNVKMVLEKLRYSEHNCAVRVNFKMVGKGYTKHPFFLCYRDSRATDKQWVKTDWSAR